ncbi:MAG TPA: hypothetical protein EYQ25_10470 [Planctomycetes bacterium]|nr:hypothetical protein [Planctomycetota bacterium]HIL38191.1 hypothetical protein [Planctomycetota bacterium]
MNVIGGGILLLFFMAVMAVILPAILIWIAVRLVGLVFRIFGIGNRTLRHGGGNLMRFAKGMLNDALSLVSGLVAAILALVLGLTNILLLRGRAVRHYFAAVEDELVAVMQCAYRLILGHPLRLLGMGPALTNLEERMPQMMAGPRKFETPGPDVPMPQTASNTPGEFEGYRVLSQLPPGGSGALLHVARPTPEKASELRDKGVSVPERVVIKAFSLETGSTLPQIVRESRALEAAGRLGLVLEHHLDESSFHYVMPFMAGDTLDVTARRLHEHSGDDGLQHGDLQDAMGHARDLTRILARFHSEGLWHKDIKPTNLIVGPTGLHVVDLGLVTPLASAMTLTTHGTEYYRDPELVRLAMKGVKVHQVDGAKFDIYGSGAVLYTLLENSFPAHGSLSRFNRPSPKALQFVVRKAMADMDSRYGAAAHMTQDLEYLLKAEDVWSVQPADLPSYRGTLAPPMEVSHRAPATTKAPYRAMGGDDWAAVSTGPDDHGPVTRAAHAAGWGPPTLQGQRHLGRTARRRKRRGPFKALALAGMGLLSITFYRAAFTNSFHNPGVSDTASPASLGTSRSEGRERGFAGNPPDEVSELDLIVKTTRLSELPPQSLILVSGPNKASAHALRQNISKAGLMPVANDASLSSETRRNWIAGAQVQRGDSAYSDPAARVRLIAWQKVNAPELDALVWLAGDDLSRTEVLVFKAAPSSED